MKIFKLSLLLVILFLAPGYAFSAGLGYLRLSLLQGDVQVKTQEAGDWEIAPLNMPLAEGDEVWVPSGGRAELQLNSGSYIRLDENSSLQILSLDRDAAQFYLPQGRAYVYFNAPPGAILQLDTPDASTRAFNKARFGVDVPDSFTDVAVYRGEVVTENSVGKTTVDAGQVATLAQDSYAEIAPLGLATDWEGWNKMRDRRVSSSRLASYRYLPPELRVYAPDFDSSGRWVQAPGYGYVWSPTVGDPDWSPYREGRWIWRGGEYVWVAYEPWGWAPYHYGRWAFISRYGWCWTPPASGAAYWGPGYVGWVRTTEYVGWVPLAPGEVYYGRGYYGPNSVNVTNVNVTQININIYKNVTVNKGVTVVRRETFNTSAPVRVNVDRSVAQRSLFTRSNISAGGPDIRPTRVTYAPTARVIAPAKLPPQRIRSLRVQEIREARPLVKERGKAVLSPRSEKLPVTVISTPRSPGRARPAPAPAAKGGRAGGAPAAAAPAQPGRPVTPRPRGAAAPPATKAPAAPATAAPAAPAPAAPAVSPETGRRVPSGRPERERRVPAAKPQVPPAAVTSPAESPSGPRPGRESVRQRPEGVPPAAQPQQQRTRHEEGAPPSANRPPLKEQERPAVRRRGAPEGTVTPATPAPAREEPRVKPVPRREAPAVAPGASERRQRPPERPGDVQHGREKPEGKQQQKEGRPEVPPGQEDKKHER